jgi:GntR family transcriptional regulator, transcriptional repressor for pyruvate dehydrogenase complex
VSADASGSWVALERVDLSARDSVSAEVTRRLLDYLLAGEVRPGQRLPPERRLAESLGVGRTVVREALKSLTLLGLIEVRQGAGTYLRSAESAFLPQVIEWGLHLGAKRTLDLVEARRVIEVGVVELAAQRVDDARLAAIGAHLEAMALSTTADAFVEADVAFHMAVAEASGNATLQQVMRGMWSLLHVWISRVMRATADFGPTREEHARILAALERRDAVAARSAMAAHLDGATRRLRATLPPDGAAGSPGEDGHP